MNETTTLQVIDHNPEHLMRRATDVAGVCKDIVLKMSCNIQNKKYIKAEGWMAIATAHGCIASSRDVKKVDGGFTAIGEIKRASDGMILSTAEGFVGRDEKRWGNADEYACRAMVQTRAISRACRAAFAHVVVMMDAGLSTTPFEEVPEGGFEDRQSTITHLRQTAGVKTAAELPQPKVLPPSPEKMRDRMLEVLLGKYEQKSILEFAIAASFLTQGQQLIDWPSINVPQNKDEMDMLVKWVGQFQDGLPIANILTPDQTAPTTPPKQEWPDDVQGSNDWKLFVMPFGKLKGTKLGDLDDSDLGYWATKFEVSETYEKDGVTKKKSPKALEADRAFRTALDAAEKAKGWTRE